MNEKHAKKLRRAAERATVGAPAIAYKRKGTTIILDKNSTRGFYQALKKQAKGKQ